VESPKRFKFQVSSFKRNRGRTLDQGASPEIGRRSDNLGVRRHDAALLFQNRHFSIGTISLRNKAASCRRTPYSGLPSPDFG